MKKIKKVRGHRRRWKHIDQWVEYQKVLDLENLEKRQRDYVKIYVHPWCDLSLINSEVPMPRGKTKKKIIEGLIEIYRNWKAQLDQLGEPYYLRIWFFEPRFRFSQVVCAIGEFSDFYSNTFYATDEPKLLHSDYGELGATLTSFRWKSYLDEDHFDNSDLFHADFFTSAEDFEEYKRWFFKELKKPHRLHKFDEPVGDATEAYSFKKGYVWVGEEKSL